MQQQFFIFSCGVESSTVLYLGGLLTRVKFECNRVSRNGQSTRVASLVFTPHFMIYVDESAPNTVEQGKGGQ